MKFRKRPVVIDAESVPGLIGLFESHGLQSWPDWAREAADSGVIEVGAHSLRIKTLEGTMVAEASDFLIRGVKGELYPCKPDIFAATYEAVT